jgi:hypothetical protein
LIREEPRYAMHVPTNCQPFGRSDRPVAALSAVTICDAIRIGFLRQSLKLSSAGAVFDGNVANSQERKRNNVTCLSTERRAASRWPLAVCLRACDADVAFAMEPGLGRQ